MWHLFYNGVEDILLDNGDLTRMDAMERIEKVQSDLTDLDESNKDIAIWYKETPAVITVHRIMYVVLYILSMAALVISMTEISSGVNIYAEIPSVISLLGGLYFGYTLYHQLTVSPKGMTFNKYEFAVKRFKIAGCIFAVEMGITAVQSAVFQKGNVAENLFLAAGTVLLIIILLIEKQRKLAGWK